MDILKLDDLLGSLQTLEMTLTSSRKSKRDYATKFISYIVAILLLLLVANIGEATFCYYIVAI